MLNASRVFAKEESQLQQQSPHKNASQHEKSKRGTNYNNNMNQCIDEENYEETYKELLKYLDLEDENYHNNPKYLKLVEGLSKRREFEAVIEERKMELEDLKKRHSDLKR